MLLDPGNPPARRTSNRRRKLRKNWRDPRWIAFREQFKKDHPWCAFHEKYGLKEPTFVPHHPFLELYDAYLEPEILKQCIPLCRSCHGALRVGLVLCPRCKAHFKRWDQPTCPRCDDELHPEVREARERARAQYKKRVRELQREARHKAQMRWLRTTLREVLQRKIEGGEIQKGHINIDTESVIEFIEKTRNPATISPKRLHQMIGMWIESGCPRAKVFQR